MFCAASVKLSCCGPVVTRNTLRGRKCCRAFATIVLLRKGVLLRNGGFTFPIFSRSPFRRARPWWPPSPLSRCVDALPRKGFSSILPPPHRYHPPPEPLAPVRSLCLAP